MPDKLKQNQEAKEEFGFIREKIKEEPLNKKKILMKLGWNAILAVVFGLVACATFVLAKPHLNKYLAQTENPTIEIPEDEQEAESEEETSKTEKVYITNTKPLEISDYENLQSEIYDIGTEANKSIVTVTGQTNDIDLFNDTYQNERKTSGLIITDNGQELLVLTDRSTIEEVESIVVTFINGESVPAQLKKYDTITGIAILSIPLDTISEEAKSAYKGAVLGNSYVIRQGTAVLALGNFSGYNYAIAQGNVTSSSGTASAVDMEFTVLATNIPASSHGSGVLINLKGEVIGLILKDFSGIAGESTLTALSISELKDIIERLSNNENIPYLGISGTTVTDEDIEKYKLPKGVFVSSVEIDSPAMAAGIKRGDIIIEFNGKEIFTTNDYEKALLDCSVEGNAKITVMRLGAEKYTEIVCNAEVNVLQ